MVDILYFVLYNNPKHFKTLKMKKIVIFLTALVLLSVLLSSCKKEHSVVVATDGPEKMDQKIIQQLIKETGERASHPQCNEGVAPNPVGTGFVITDPMLHSDSSRIDVYGFYFYFDQSAKWPKIMAITVSWMDGGIKQSRLSTFWVKSLVDPNDLGTLIMNVNVPKEKDFTIDIYGFSSLSCSSHCLVVNHFQSPTYFISREGVMVKNNDQLEFNRMKTGGQNHISYSVQ